MNEIRVTVYRPASKKFFQCQWIDPVTGRKRTKSTGTNIRRDAERFAGSLQQQLEEGTFQDCSRITWVECRERYEQEVLPGRAKKTDEKVRSVFNQVENHQPDETVCSRCNSNQPVLFRVTKGRKDRSDHQKRSGSAQVFSELVTSSRLAGESPADRNAETDIGHEGETDHTGRVRANVDCDSESALPRKKIEVREAASREEGTRGNHFLIGIPLVGSLVFGFETGRSTRSQLG